MSGINNIRQDVEMRQAYQQYVTAEQEGLIEQVTPQAIALDYDADIGMDVIREANGTIRYARSQTNGVRGIGDAVLLHEGQGIPTIDAMPAPRPKQIGVIEPALIFNFYAGFDRLIATAKDTGRRSLPIKSLLDNSTLYSGNEAGFVSTKDGFIYSSGGVGLQANTVLYKINATTLEVTTILTLASGEVSALCLASDGTLFAFIRLGLSDGEIYKRSPEGITSTYPFSGPGFGSTWSIASLDGVTLYLVVGYYSIYKFNTLSSQLTLVRGEDPSVSESTFFFADNTHQTLYLFGLATNADAARGQSIFWRLAENDLFEEYYRFPIEADGNLSRFYGLPSRSAIADSKTKTIFMLGLETIYTKDNGFGATISNTNKIIRLDRTQRLTDLTLDFDDSVIEQRFDFFGQLDWIY